ncbi:MAG TPA: tRNA pseudouridine(55) synthase TruB [Thermohalobaculum sp.]|nr:tRNA pseudouridine(55) synthase TruB [Thermohalobaculum sp.]
MAGRRKGDRVDGWVVLDKPVGVTSTQAVGKARWAFNARKAGHAGTLDPLGSGVLPIALGEATKTIPVVQDGLKTYRFSIRLGQATATDDAEGAVIASSHTRPTDAAIAAALGAYIGDIAQVPPQFSAVKVAGERAYDLAREGVALDLAPRALRVARLALVARPDPDHAELELVCGKGGYVRAIARDLGRDLGCHAHVSQLRRLRSGPFTLAHAISFEMLDEIRHRGGSEHLLPVATGLDDIPALAVPPAAAARLKRGQAVPVPATGLEYGDLAWASLDGQPLAIGTFKAGQFHPDRVFNLED